MHATTKLRGPWRRRAVLSGWTGISYQYILIFHLLIACRTGLRSMHPELIRK